MIVYFSFCKFIFKNSGFLRFLLKKSIARLIFLFDPKKDTIMSDQLYESALKILSEDGSDGFK